MPLRKAILINPPNPPGWVSNKDSMGGFGQLYPTGAPPFPPLDLPYLAAALVQEGFTPEVIEANALGLTTEGLCQTLAEKADLAESLVMVRTSLPTIDHDLGVCGELKKRLPIGRLGLYGPVVKSLRFRVERDPSIDFAILGEPDGPVLELMRGTPLDAIAGILHRTPEGWRLTAERPFTTDLDAQPFPRWDFLPYERYVIPRSSTAGEKRFLPMLSSRGCPFGCSYCPYPIGQGLPWRFRSPGNVVDEMEHLVKDLGVQYILFRDPMFSMRPRRVVEICEEIVRRGLKVEWRCETRVDYLDEPTLQAMAKAGCSGINFGVESTDPVIQQGVHRKPILVAEFEEKVALCRKYDIKTFAFFIVGLPGDTVDTILDTIEFAVRIRPTWIQFTVATPFIGTPLHKWAVDHGLVGEKHYELISSHVGSMGNENLTPAQVHRLHRFAQILQDFLINRKGVLKNADRKDLPYRLVKGAADGVFGAATSGFFRLGRRYFRSAYRAGASGGAPASA